MFFPIFRDYLAPENGQKVLIAENGDGWWGWRGVAASGRRWAASVR